MNEKHSKTSLQFSREEKIQWTVRKIRGTKGKDEEVEDKQVMWY